MRERGGPLLARQLDPEDRQQDAEHDHRGGCRKDHLRMPRLAQRVRSGAKPEDRETPDSGRDHDDHRRKHRDAVGRKLERPRHGEHQPADEEARQRRGSRAHDADFSRGYPPSVPEPSYSSGDDYVVEFLGYRFGFNAFDFEQRVTAAAVKLGLLAGNELDDDETADLVELVERDAIEAPRSSLGRYLVRRWDEVSLVGGESLVYWLKKLVFRGAWLDHRVKEGKLEVGWDDESAEFCYHDPNGGRALLELLPTPSWRDLQYPR